MNAAAAASASLRDTGRARLAEQQRQALESIVRRVPLPEVLSQLCLIAESQCEQQVVAGILLVDAEAQRLRTGAAPSLPADYNRAIDGVVISRDIGTCSACAALGEEVVTPDIAAAPGWQGLSHLPLGLGLRSCWSTPIRSSTGDILGTFGAYLRECRVPTEAERQLTGLLAQTAALAIERERADAQLQADADRNGFLAQLADSTRSLRDPDQVMQVSARLLALHLGADRCAYAEVDGSGMVHVTGEYAAADLPPLHGAWPLAGFGPSCQQTLLAGLPFVVDDAEADPGIPADALPSFQETGMRAFVGVPLHKDDALIGILSVQHQAARHWTPDEVMLVAMVANRCWEALERARVERNLARSEERYRAIVESNPECVKVVDRDGRIVHMNQAGLRLVEADDAGQVLGACVYDLIAPECRDRFIAFNQRVCDGEQGSMVFDLVGRHGTRRSMETLGVPLPTADGSTHQLAFTRDVTARVMADRALEESRSRLDYTVRLSGVGFWYCDLPFSDLIWDARVREHFFLPADAPVTIDTFYERLHPEDRERTRLAIETSIARHLPYDVVYRTTDPASDAIKWIRALGGTIYAPDGTALRFDGVTVDVTAQRRAQEDLTRLLEGEREQVRLLASVADAARTIHGCDSVQSVLEAATGLAREIIGAHQAVSSTTLGREHAQAITAVSLSDKYARYREYRVPPNGNGIYALVCEGNQSMRLTQDALEAHPRWRGFSGEGHAHPPMRGWLAAPLVAHDGRNLGLVQLSDRVAGEFDARDEAVLAQLARIASVALENAGLYQQLREQDRRKDEFLATLAHELRNPLAPMRNGLAILRMSRDPEVGGRVQDVLERQVTHLTRLVDDLLDVSRITRDKITLLRERLDLHAVAGHAVDVARPVIDAGRHRFELQPAAGPLWVEGDPTRLTQVLSNLLNNAAKYTPAGGRIRARLDRDGSEAVIEVSDDGIGMDAALLPRVFDLFTQAEDGKQRAQGGLGIGLTLVRRLVLLHGGSIQASSPGSGLGSTFTIRLPLWDATGDVPREAPAGDQIGALP